MNLFTEISETKAQLISGGYDWEFEDGQPLPNDGPRGGNNPGIDRTKDGDNFVSQADNGLDRVALTSAFGKFESDTIGRSVIEDDD